MPLGWGIRNWPHYGFTEDGWNEMVGIGIAYLKEQASLGRLVTYSDISAYLQSRIYPWPDEASRDPWANWLFQALYFMSARTNEEDGVLVTASVVHKGENQPGKGFYAMARDELSVMDARDKDDEHRFWVGELARVRYTYSG